MSSNSDQNLTFRTAWTQAFVDHMPDSGLGQRAPAVVLAIQRRMSKDGTRSFASVRTIRETAGHRSNQPTYAAIDDLESSGWLLRLEDNPHGASSIVRVPSIPVGLYPPNQVEVDNESVIELDGRRLIVPSAYLDELLTQHPNATDVTLSVTPDQYSVCGCYAQCNMGCYAQRKGALRSASPNKNREQEQSLTVTDPPTHHAGAREDDSGTAAETAVDASPDLAAKDARLTPVDTKVDNLESVESPGADDDSDLPINSEYDDIADTWLEQHDSLADAPNSKGQIVDALQNTGADTDELRRFGESDTFRRLAERADHSGHVASCLGEHLRKWRKRDESPPRSDSPSGSSKPWQSDRYRSKRKQQSGDYSKTQGYEPADPSEYGGGFDDLDTTTETEAKELA